MKPSYVLQSGIQWEDFHFTKENPQNYGCCTTQNLL